MSDQTAAGLEEPLLQARQRPALDGQGQGQPASQIADVIRDDPEQQADLIGPEPCFALLDPLLRGPALVVEADDSPVPVSVVTMKPTRGNNSPR